MEMHPMVIEWVSELAKHTGRTEAEIRSGGLSAGDFPVSQRVEIIFPDRSHLRFYYAFALVNWHRKMVGVFTEHCGYITLPLQPGMKIIHARRDVYYHE